MSLKTYKPYTKSTRTTILVDRKGVWKGRPLKSLTVGKVSTGGRNNLGRITSRAKGSGHKKRYRMIDFYRNKLDALPIEWLGKIYRKIHHAILDCNPCNLQGWVLLISWPGYCRIGQASYEKPSEK